VTDSRALCVDNGQQAGWVHLGDIQRASLWNGTAASRVDLHPDRATASVVLSIDSGRLVGYAIIDGVHHASMWTGDAASWEDLSLALSGSWGDTNARGIWSDENTIYVAGSGFNNESGRSEALLWTACSRFQRHHRRRDCGYRRPIRIINGWGPCSAPPLYASRCSQTGSDAINNDDLLLSSIIGAVAAVVPGPPT
jgi:hypothetical protein